MPQLPRLSPVPPPDPERGRSGGGWRARAPLASLQQLSAAGAVAASIFWLVHNNGTFSVTSRNAVAIVVWWAIVLTAALGLARLRRPTREGAVLGGLLLAFGLLTLASVVWAPDTARAVEEFNRVSLYFGVFVLVVAIGTAVRPVSWSDGLAIGIAAVAVFSLVTRLVPELVNTGAPLRLLPAGQARLAFPIGYWNALAILVAIGLPLLLRTALEARGAIARGLAAGVVPVLGGVVFLTSSRAGSLAAAAGMIVFVVACNRRAAATVLLVVGGAGAAVAISELKSKSALVNGPLDSAAAATQGHAAVLPVVLACVVVGLVWGFASRWVGSVRLPALERGIAVGVVLLVAAAIVLAHPVGRFDQFKQTQAVSADSADYATQHLLNASGNGRWQMWTVSAHEFEAHPLVGGGAGSFQSHWIQNRPFALFVVNAHSLYVEVLGELGIVGLLLIAGFTGGALFVGGTRVVRAPPERRTLAAALVAALVAYVLGAAVDWMWQMTAVTIVAVVIVAVLAGVQQAVTPSRRRDLPKAAGAVVALVGAAAILAQALPMVSAMELSSSQSAAGKGDLATAAKRAASARAATPWSSEPYLQLALIQEHGGALARARTTISRATARAPEDWQVWAIRARIEAEAGAIGQARTSLHKAERLNPLWAKSIGASV